MSPEARQRLTRSRDDRWIAGICGGLAQFTGLNVRGIRLAFLLFGLFGIGELVYIVLWFLMPKEDRFF